MTAGDEPSLEVRLSAAGVVEAADPVETWRRLRHAEGSAATLIDLYELVARRRGLAARDLSTAERRELVEAVMPEMWPGWNVTPGSERAEEAVEVVEYDPGWPDRYQAWQLKIRKALGGTTLRVDHVGSTAVPGLPAKPVIDIQVSVLDLAAEDAYVPRLEGIGLQLRSRDVWHRYFRPFPDRPREVHVHVCATGSQWERDHLRFRELLLARPEARARYARAKREAAAAWPDDRLAYTDAKTAVILGILGEPAHREGPPAGERRA